MVWLTDSKIFQQFDGRPKAFSIAFSPICCIKNSNEMTLCIEHYVTQRHCLPTFFMSWLQVHAAPIRQAFSRSFFGWDRWPTSAFWTSLLKGRCQHVSKQTRLMLQRFCECEEKNRFICTCPSHWLPDVRYVKPSFREAVHTRFSNLQDWLVMQEWKNWTSSSLWKCNLGLLFMLYVDIRIPKAFFAPCWRHCEDTLMMPVPFPMVLPK